MISTTDLATWREKAEYELSKEASAPGRYQSDWNVKMQEQIIALCDALDAMAKERDHYRSASGLGGQRVVDIIQTLEAERDHWHAQTQKAVELGKRAVSHYEEGFQYVIDSDFLGGLTACLEGPDNIQNDSPPTLDQIAACIYWVEYRGKDWPQAKAWNGDSVKNIIRLARAIQRLYRRRGK